MSKYRLYADFVTQDLRLSYAVVGIVGVAEPDAINCCSRVSSTTFEKTHPTQKDTGFFHLTPT